HRPARHRFDPSVSRDRSHPHQESARPAALRHARPHSMTDITRPVAKLASPDILTRIEADCDAAVGRAFVSLAAEYFAQTRSRDGRVSTPHTPAGLAARFEEAVPKTGRSIDTIV